MLDNFLLTLFEKYAELLKKRFSEDFQEIVSTDDYMPMPISNTEEYDKVINVSWFSPDKPREELRLEFLWSFRNWTKLTSTQLPMCTPILSDVPSLLHRYSEFPQPILLLLGRSFSTP